MLAPQLFTLLEQLAPLVMQQLGPAEQPQQLLPQPFIVCFDGLCVHDKRMRSLPLRATRQGLHALACLALKGRLVFQEEPLHAVKLPVSYTHLTLPTTGSLCRSRWSPYH